MCNHHSECFIIQRVWCWRLKNLNRDWICDGCSSVSSRSGGSIPIPTIIRIITKRSLSLDLDTPYVDDGHLHLSSTKVEFCNNKSPAPTRCSRIHPNFHLKDSANRNSGFLVQFISPWELRQWSDKHRLGLYLGSYVTERIRRRHRKHIFQNFRVGHFRALYAPPWPKQGLVLTLISQRPPPWCLEECWFKIS